MNKDKRITNLMLKRAPWWITKGEGQSFNLNKKVGQVELWEDEKLVGQWGKEEVAYCFIG